MFVAHSDEIVKERLANAETLAVEKQILIGPKQGWRDYVMRQFTLGPYGYAPLHSHDFPHIVYVVAGEGNLLMEGTDHFLRAGSIAYIDANAQHQISNTHQEQFIFLCIVPKEGEG